MIVKMEQRTDGTTSNLDVGPFFAVTNVHVVEERYSLIKCEH